jgi:hypothetical protein
VHDRTECVAAIILLINSETFHCAAESTARRFVVNNVDMNTLWRGVYLSPNPF